MIESVLTNKKVSLKIKVTVKSLISLGIIALAVILPQLVHLVAGAQAGMKWLPMYLPVLLGGALLGSVWGFGIGILSPLVSFLITSAFGNPMPMAARLPFMTIELAVFAGICGLFSKKIMENPWIAFPVVLLAQITGMATFMILVIIFQNVTPFTPTVIFEQIQMGLLGLILQALIVPFIIMELRAILVKKDHE